MVTLVATTSKDISRSQGMPRTAPSHQKLKGGHGMDSPSEPPEGTNTAGTLLLDF